MLLPRRSNDAVMIYLSHESRVPHISLVFCEMWDTTDLNTASFPVSDRVMKLTAVASHISRKTSEIWGTRWFVTQGN